MVLANDIYVFGGFGISADPTDPFKPSNPMDMWVSRDGADWRLLDSLVKDDEMKATLKPYFAVVETLWR